MYALDTNTVIYFFKDKGNVKTRLLDKKPSELVIPSIVAYEIEVGIRISKDPLKKQQAFEALLGLCKFQPFNRAESRAAAKIRDELEKKGLKIGPMDTLIAGTALANGFTLVTHNLAEFSRIRELKVEDWWTD